MGGLRGCESRARGSEARTRTNLVEERVGDDSEAAGKTISAVPPPS